MALASKTIDVDVFDYHFLLHGFAAQPIECFHLQKKQLHETHGAIHVRRSTFERVSFLKSNCEEFG